MPQIKIPKISFNKQTKQLTAAIENEVERAALGFHSSIISAWPVDTGFSRGGWQAPVQVKPGTWEVINSVEYAPVLWAGLHTVGDRQYGSIQMPAGGYPVLARTISQMNENIRKL